MKKRMNKIFAVVLSAALTVGTVLSGNPVKAEEVDETTYPWTPIADGSTGDYIADSYSAIGSEHVFESVTQERLLDLLSSNGNYYIIFGGPEHESSQKLLPLVNQQAKQDGITKIYHFDPVIDGYQIDITDPDTEFQGNFSRVRTEDGSQEIVTHSVYELWERIQTFLPEEALGKYTSDDTLLLAYQNQSVKASYLYTGQTDEEDDAILEEITQVFRGGDRSQNVVAGEERSDFDFFQRVYNAAAASVETSVAEPTEDRLAKEVEIFTEADREGFALHQVNFNELIHILNSPGEHYLFFGASWCHNTQAIIGSVARKAKANGIQTVYVYDTTLGNQLEFGTGDQMNTVVGRSSVFNSRTSVDVETGYNNISYLYGELVEYLGDFITENNTRQNNSIAFYPNGNLHEAATEAEPWSIVEAGQRKNAIRLQMPFLIAYDNSQENPVTRQWIHKNAVNDGTYTEYMLELAWVLATEEAKSNDDTIRYDGLTKVQFAAEAVDALSDVLGNQPIADVPGDASGSGNSQGQTANQNPAANTQTNIGSSQTVKQGKTDGQQNVVKLGKAKITKAVKKKKSKVLNVTIQKISAAAGYQIKVLDSKKALVTKNVTKTKMTIRSGKIKNSKKLFVQVRAYQKAGSKKKYGAWSAVRKVTIK